MAYEMVMPYHLHMPSYFLETFTEYPYNITYNTLLDKRIYGMLVKLKERMDQIIFILMLSI